MNHLAKHKVQTEKKTLKLKYKSFIKNTIDYGYVAFENACKTLLKI